MSRGRPERGRGFLLLPVALLLGLVGAAAFALTLQSGISTNAAAQVRDQREALYVAQAGLSHALFAANGTCGGFALAPQQFGAHSYSAAFTPAFGSPVDAVATGTLANGVSRKVERRGIRTYEAPRSEVLQPGPTGQDAAIRDNVPWLNAGGAASLDLSTVNLVFPERNRILLRFDLSNIPSAATILSAELELYQLEALFGGTGNVDAHRVTRSWVEAETTWSRATAATNWSSAGGDYEVAYAARTRVDPTLGWHRWDLAGLVQDWVSGAHANRGVLLRPSQTLQKRSFVSSESPLEPFRPRLVITYACECGVSGANGTLVERPGVAGDDTYVDADDPGKNFGDEERMRLSNRPGDETRGLLRFDLSGIPPLAVVSSATLELRLDDISGGGSGTVAVHRISEDWDEGAGGGAGCADGATWTQRDAACTPWASEGVSHDAAVAASAPINDADTPTPVAWDVTGLVRSWAEGTQPNHGMLLIPSFGLDNADFDTGDASNPARHPKLTVEFFCPCGSSCDPPPPWGNRLLMVVVDAANLGAGEVAHATLVESWDFEVSYLSAAADEATYALALAASDVVFVTEDVDSGSVGWKLTNAAIGVVSEEVLLSDEFGLSAGFSWRDEDRIDVEDDTHWITEPFALGALTVLDTSESLARLSGALAPDLLVLGSESSLPSLVALERGGERNDGIGGSEARRVQLPWGSNAHDVNHLNQAGRTLLERSLQWAATPPPPTLGYLDRFAAPTCNPFVDYTRSDGTRDWSAQPWQETDDGSPCTGNVRVVRAQAGNRLRIQGDGTAIERQVDLSSYAIASLHFRHRAVGALDATRLLRVLASGDGGATFSELGVIDSPGDGSYQSLGLGLTPLIAPDTVIRFEAVGLTSGRAVHLDDIALVEAGSGGTYCSNTYRDEFNAQRFDNQDGTLAWSTNWLEINENDGAGAGDVYVDGDVVTNALVVKDNDGGGEGAEREADLTGTLSATLKFHYRRTSFDDADDYVSVAVSADGGANWSELERFAGPANEPTYTEVDHPLDLYMKPNTRIRFLSSPDLGDSDRLFVDDVEICIQ